MVGIGKPIDDVEVVAVGLLDGARQRAEPGPDVGEQRVLAHELGALAGAHPACQPDPLDGPQQRRTFGECLGLVELQVSVQGKPHHRPEIMNA